MAPKSGFEIVREHLPADLSGAVVKAMANVGYRLADAPRADEPYRSHGSSRLSLRFEPDAQRRPLAFGRFHVWQENDRTLCVVPTAGFGLHSSAPGPLSVLSSIALFAALVLVGEYFHVSRVMQSLALLPAIVVAFRLRVWATAGVRRAVMEALADAVDQVYAAETASANQVGRVRVIVQVQPGEPLEVASEVPRGQSGHVDPSTDSGAETAKRTR